eukprot:jgi/Galph1/2304/GphlegSOOS_G1016.1
MLQRPSLEPTLLVENFKRFPSDIIFQTGSMKDFSGELIVLGVLESRKESLQIPQEFATAVPAEVRKAFELLIKESEFQGKIGASHHERVFFSERGAKYLAVFGMGKMEDEVTSLDAFKKLGTFLGQLGSQYKQCTTAGIWTASTWSQAQAQAFAEEVLLTLYKDERFKSNVDESDSFSLKQVQVFQDVSLNDAFRRSKSFCSGIVLTKELISAPANVVTPTLLAQVATHLGKHYGMECKILNKEQCEELKMGCYLGVAQGSTEPPKFIHLKYAPANGQVKKKIALIGKAITFDSGGYNLKSGMGSMIELMKFDMGGCAAVLGAAKVIGELKPEHVEVHFIAAACENMISGDAYHPGDILEASNGKTVEIMNTDAEGRLTLADALVYAENIDHFDCIIDVATLTGAIIIALGNDYAGFWSNREELAQRIEQAAKTRGEKVWKLPLVNEYIESLKSRIADLKNVGGRAGGSIVAAIFLREFVKHTPWAHIDIAGTVWNEKQSTATGFGVRTLVEVCESYSREA